MPSQVLHIMMKTPNAPFHWTHNWIFSILQIKGQINAMFVVLMKTLYALIQQHSDPCLYWALDMCLFYFKLLAYSRFLWRRISRIRILLSFPLKISIWEIFSLLVVFALCFLALKCEALDENRGITCGQNEPIHPLCFPIKSAGQLLNVYTWFFTRHLHFTELNSLASTRKIMVLVLFCLVAA